MEKTYNFKVEITCDGCVNAIKRSLSKSLGDKLKNVDANVETKAVAVTVHYPDESSELTAEQMLDL
ncbi:hypothetical protein B4U79_00131, partial [Dinothrombium tinctorium]